MNNLGRNSRFYIIFAVALIVAGALVIYTFRSVFSAVETAYEVEVEVPDAELRINEEQLDSAYRRAYEKEIVPLDVE
ncbi:MAG: hypothetical protein PVJ52_02615 [Candidatus Woesebacteria bacterium]|jgi:hypothetical protein